MRLQGHAARTDPVTAERVNGYVDTLDEIIKKIRTSIFGLQQTRQAPASLPARLMEIIDEHAPQLGFTVGISFVGPLDPGPGETVAHDILAVTREAPARRTQPRYLPVHHPRQRRHPPDLDRPHHR